MDIIFRLLGFVRPYRGQVALAIAAVALSSAFVIVTPLLIRWAIDTAIDPREDGGFDGSTGMLVVVAVALIAVAAARGAFTFAQTYLGEVVAQRVAFDIRNQIYDRVQRLSFAYHDQAQTGQLMSRATQDVESIRFFVSMGVIRLAYVVLLLVGVLAVMLASNPTLALVSWAFLPIIAWRSIAVTMRLRPLWTNVQEGMGRMGTVLQENLSGIRVVKAFSREDLETQKFEREARLMFNNAYEASRQQAINSPLMNGLWAISIAVTIWFGGREIDAGRLTVGELTQFTLFLTLLQLPVRSLGWIVMIMARANSSGQRIFDVLDAESAVNERPGAIELRDADGAVRFEGVAFGYDAVSPVLREVNIDARPGELVALLGPTGSGKTTIVNLMPRFYDVTAGRITIDGIDIRDVTLASLRRTIGVVQQDVFLFADTIRENIRYGVTGADDAAIERAARTAGIHDFIVSLPDGYDTWVGERGITLSGGQKQRVAIARTLLIDPRILVFDDSTSSVDSETEYLIQRALAELMRGRTTFVIAQRLRTVQAADQILVLESGRIIERGRHDELLARDGAYRSIYELELRDQEQALLPGGGEPEPRHETAAAGT